MKKKCLAGLSLLLALCLMLTACNGGGNSGGVTDPTDISGAYTSTGDMDFTVTDRDTRGTYDAVGATAVHFADGGIMVSGAGAVAEGKTLTVTQAGTYLLSGNAADSAITVEVGESDKVQLVLLGLTLTSTNRPALYIRAADKVFLTLGEGTVNSLSDGASYAYTDGDSTPDGVIFSRADLTVNGAGSLTVTAVAKHGVVSKDDLIITGGDITVTAPNVGLCGKDCVKVTGGSITVEAGSDGIRADNTEDASRGFVYIAGGELAITAGKDGIQAETVLRVGGGTLMLTTGGGSQNGSTHTDGSFNPNWGFGGTSGATDTAESAKGLKCTTDILIEGGTVTVDSADDALHANGSIAISGGVFTLRSGDDGIHADNALGITGGAIHITKSYEGLEATDIVIGGGKHAIVASDDGLNAAGGNDASSISGRPGQGFFEETTGSLSITGGYLLVNAAGDGLDSNGALTVTGGVTLVSGPTNSGNGALDYATTASVSGGVVIALGAQGMATGFTAAENQGAIFVSFSTQAAGKSLALCDTEGNVIASFTPEKAYSSAVITAPGISASGTYTLVVGGTVTGADENGYAQGATLSGGSTLTGIEMDGYVYGSSNIGGMPGMGGGGMRPGRPGW